MLSWTLLLSLRALLSGNSKDYGLATFFRNYGVNYGTETYKRTIILGTKDDVIDPKETKMLFPVGYNKAKFEEIEGMGHRTPLDVFINMYNKHV